MRRLLLNDLIKWKEKKNRLPLILRGARQVGKTWLLHEFVIGGMPAAVNSWIETRDFSMVEERQHDILDTYLR